MDNLVELYCVVDEFAKEFFPEFEKAQLEFGVKRRLKACGLSQSEIMTIMIYFHQLRFRDFKTYYTHYVQKHLRQEFPDLVSYNRFIELITSILLPMCFFMHAQQKTLTGTQRLLRHVTSKEPPPTRSLKALPKKANPQWGGFLALNYTC